MLITADQLLCHAVGDYILQSDYMANEKTKKSIAALAHVVAYSLPFLFLSLNWRALAFIAGTHFIIDRWRLARYVCWIKNFMAPRWIVPTGEPGDPVVVSFPQGKDPNDPLKGAVVRPLRNYPWTACRGTGYGPRSPAWLATWLMIICDNCMHVVCNGLALAFLG